jgi:hypothetical protein
MVARLYSHDDVGAPVLGTTNDGSLLNILRACLVDGYGTRTPAGWTIPFSDIPNKKIIFGTVGGGAYFRLDDNYSYNWAKVRGYLNVTDIDTGTGEFPTINELPSASYFTACSKRYAVSVGYEKWHVIADDEWFYFITHNPADDIYPGGVFFGKIEHVDPLSEGSWMLTSHATTSSQTGTTFPESIFKDTSFGYWFLNDNYYLTGVPERIKESYDNTAILNPNPITGKLELYKRELITNIAPFVRVGRRPNIFHGFGNTVNVYRGGDKVTFNTVTYLVCKLSKTIILISYDVGVG